MGGSIRAAALVVGAVVFAGVILSIGVRETWDALGQADLVYLALSCAMLALSSCVRIMKWAFIRGRMGARVGLLELSAIYFSSKFWGLVSPMRSGEVVPALFRSGEGAQRGRLLSLILYDRVIETFQSLIVFFALFFLLYGVFFDMKTGYALTGITLVLLAFTSVLISRRAGDWIFGLAESALAIFGDRRTPSAVRGFLRGVRGEMDEFYEATMSYFTVGFSLYVLLLTFVAWGVDMVFFLMMFKAFGIGTELLVTLSSVMVYTMVSALAPVPGGLGVSDLTFALVIGHFGYRGEVGGLIIAARVLGAGSVFLGYAASRAALMKWRPAPG